MEIVKETSRLEAFSDGVFGFAITLLVLDAHVPIVAGEKKLFDLLIADWATYLAFLIGFFTILICWINHHFMFDYIYKSNSKLLLFNGFKLLVVTFTPFATAVLSNYINTAEQETAVSFYTFNFALMGMAMFGIWLYAFKAGLMKAEPAIPFSVINRYYFLAAAMSVSIFILSFVSIWLCLGLSGLMFIIFLFPEQMLQYIARISRKRP